MAPHSRVWWFTANRPFTHAEADELRALLADFTATWQAHGADLKAGYSLLYDCVVCIAVDENFTAPSGCSIDKAFRILQDFGSRHRMDLFQRTLLIVPEGDSARILTKTEVAEAIQSGKIQSDTLVLNTLEMQLNSGPEAALIPFENSWLGRQLAANLLAK
ncbi:MAG: hypothetical protein JNL57_13355 [Bacteroidetes bacterium]|nr:hypothetical protein [Bacteroidota bacterium]